MSTQNYAYWGCCYTLQQDRTRPTQGVELNTPQGFRAAGQGIEGVVEGQAARAGGGVGAGRGEGRAGKNAEGCEGEVLHWDLSNQTVIDFRFVSCAKCLRTRPRDHTKA